MTKYKFTISMECDVLVEADNKEDARMQVINNMNNGNYDQLMNPDASAYIDEGKKVSEDE